MADARKQTFLYEAWVRDPKDSTKDTKVTEGKIEAVSAEIAKQVAIGKLYAENEEAVLNGQVEVNVRPF